MMATPTSSSDDTQFVVITLTQLVIIALMSSFSWSNKYMILANGMIYII